MIGTISARSALRLGLGMGASVLAMTTASQALAQAQCTNVTPDGLCEIENSGSRGSLALASRARLINTGSITGAPAVTGSVPVPPVNTPTVITLIIENRTGATITGTGGTAVSSPGTLINAGTINGNVTGLTQYVADGGVLNGNLVLGSGLPNDFNPQIFVQRGDSGVTGTISAGAGIDYFVQSYAASETLPIALGGGLPTTFEVEGVEVRGADTTVVLASLPGDTIRGLGLLGDGNIVSTATIGVSNAVGAGFPSGVQLFTTAISYLGSPETTSFLTQRFLTSAPGVPPQFAVYQTGIGAALNSFVNAGTVNGDIRMTTAEFVNSGALNLVTRATGTLITTAEDRDFSFSNTGTISYIDNGARAGMAMIEAQYLGDEEAAYAVRIRTLRTSEARNVTIANSGTLQGGLGGFLVGGTVSFENSGAMSGMNGANALAHGVQLNIGGLRAFDDPDAPDAASVSITNTGSGTIDDGLRVSANARNLTFTNDGSITGRADDGRAVSIDHEGTDESDVDTFAFVNGGDLDGDVVLNTSASTATFENSGTIAMGERTEFDPNSGSWEAVEFEVSTQGSQTVSLANSGAIEQGNRGGVGVSIEMESAGASTVDIVNSGTIRSDAGGSVVDGTLVGFEQGTQAVNVSIGLAVSAGDVAGQANVTIDNRAGGVISAAGVYAHASEDGATPSPDGSTAYSTALLVTADAVTITNAGTISGGTGVTLPDGYALTADHALPDNYLAGAIQTGASVDRLTNSETGVITGSIDLGAGNDSFANYGTITGDIFLRDGNDSYIHLLAASFTGTADGGAGEDSLSIDLTGSDGVVSNALYEQFINFELFSLISNGTGLVVEDGGSLDLGEDSRIDTPGETAVQGGTEGETVSNGGTIIGDVDLGGGDNSFANEGTITGDVTTGEGSDTFSNSAGGTIAGGIDLGDGDDSFSNEGDIIGDVALGGGADSYELGQGSVSGVVDGGSGGDIDSIVVNFTPAQPQGRQSAQAVVGSSITITPDTLGNVQGFEQIAVNGPGTVTASGDLPVGVIALRGAALNILAGTALGTTGPDTVIGSSGAETINNAGTIKGGISLGDGADEITNSGSIVGPVDLGQGDDRLTLGSGASFSGAVSGGAGTDVLGLATTGTAAAPHEFSAAGFTDFERLTNLSGAAAISGAAAFGQIDVAGGRLIGRAGSMLTGNVAVANGATFGSAGTVNGNVTVASGGTLSPGASPGVMTVNGNVSLAGGTTTIFEFQPSPLLSDQLLISGALNIASGATLSLTGDRPLTPGVAYDLIIATGGISGTFTTVNQVATVLGFLRYSTDRLQLLGTFQVGAGVSPQTTASIDYVNAVLVAGASAELLAAVPSLLASDGTANAAAFALVGPEAYASASELGIERGLGLAKAGRAGLAVTNRVEPGPFAFAQGIGDWRELDSDAALGIAGADIESYGVLGGVGYGSERGSIGAFVGTIDSEQRIPDIAARTEADGIVAGVIGRFAVGGFDLSAMVAYDWGNADTARAVPADGGVSGSYRLRSLVLDASAGYALPISAGWALRPEIGITHIATDRGATTETGSPAFSLAVQKSDHKATFIDGGIKLLGGREAGATFRPWIAAGIRHQLNGERASANAAFDGNTLGFTLPGVSRAETVAIAGAGASIDLGSNVSLYGAYQGEFGEGSDHNLNLGIRIGF